MKKSFLLILFGLLLAQTGFSQDAIAKLKFEDAEEAYSKEDYSTTLSKLDDAEKILGKTNPKILYLRIVSQDKIISADPYKDYTILENTRKNCSYYLKEYEKVEGIEEKYRDVYKISEKLAQYPNTVQAFSAEKQRIKDAEETRKSDEALNKQKIEDAFKNFAFYKDFKIGLTLDETYKLYPAYKKHYEFKDVDGLSIGSKNNPDQHQPTGLYVKNNIVYGYYIIVYSIAPDDAQYSMGTKSVEEIINRLNSEFLFTPKETTTENTSKVDGKDFYSTGIEYTWSKNNKTIILNQVKSTYGSQHLTSVSFFSKDKSLIK